MSIRGRKFLLPTISRFSSLVECREARDHSPISNLFQGQEKSSREASGQIRISYSIAFFIIVLILMAYFNSVPHAMIIIMMIPLSLLGVFWGHGIHGATISMMSLWGLGTRLRLVSQKSLIGLSHIKLD